MSGIPSSSEWAAARGERWRAQLTGVEAMLAPVDDPLIDALRLDRPCRVADVGCGGGRTTLEILQRAPAGCIVHGFDISPALIESARARIPGGEGAIAFHLADVSKHEPPQTLYDRLTSRFGIMFYEDPPRAFANLARWLAPMGRFAFAAWGPLAENPWMTTIRETVAEVVDLPEIDPDAPGPFRYAVAETLVALLDRAGFVDITVQEWRGALPVGGGLPAAEAAQFALASFSSFAELLAQAGEAAADAARKALTARFSRHQSGGVVRLDACVHIVTGTRSRVPQ